MLSSTDIEKFCVEYDIEYKTMSLEMTDELNSFMSCLWQGTTGKLNWKATGTNYEEIIFPNEIDDDIVNKIVGKLNFKILHEDQIYLYFSGSEQLIKINTRKFFINLFNFMDEFSYLDFVYFFILNGFQKYGKINAIELRVFEYMCGNI